MDMLTRLDADTAALRLRMQQQTRQVSTGLRSELLGDLSGQLPRLLNLRAEMTRTDAYTQSIGQALTRTQATQTALARLGEIAREFGDDVAMKLDANNPDTIPLMAARAKLALVEVGQLLNSRSNGEYLFAGSDFGNPPVPDPNGLPASAFATRIASAVGSLGGGNAVAVAADTLGAVQDDSAGNSPFSPFLQSGGGGQAEGQRSIPSGDGVQTAFGIIANRNGAAVSQGETSGSWALDLLRGLASIAALTPVQAADRNDFRDLSITIREGLRSAAGALADESGALGLAEQRLEATRSRHQTLRDALESQVADIQEVDLAATLTRLKATQTTLEASYMALGRIGELSLTRYLA
jgi:flagellin-like hook-associated protein FlgL